MWSENDATPPPQRKTGSSSANTPSGWLSLLWSQSTKKKPKDEGDGGVGGDSNGNSSNTVGANGYSAVDAIIAKARPPSSNTKRRVNFPSPPAGDAGSAVDADVASTPTGDKLYNDSDNNEGSKKSLKHRVATPYSKLHPGPSFTNGGSQRKTPSKSVNPITGGSFSIGSSVRALSSLSSSSKHRLRTNNTRKYKPSKYLMSKRKGREAGAVLLLNNTDSSLFAQRLQHSGLKRHFDATRERQEEAEKEIQRRPVLAKRGRLLSETAGRLMPLPSSAEEDYESSTTTSVVVEERPPKRRRQVGFADDENAPLETQVTSTPSARTNVSDRQQTPFPSSLRGDRRSVGVVGDTTESSCKRVGPSHDSDLLSRPPKITAMEPGSDYSQICYVTELDTAGAIAVASSITVTGSNAPTTSMLPTETCCFPVRVRGFSRTIQASAVSVTGAAPAIPSVANQELQDGKEDDPEDAQPSKRVKTKSLDDSSPASSPAPASSSSNSLAAFFSKQFEGTWKCPSCLGRVDKNKDVCGSCGTAKPDSASSGSGSSTPAIPTTNGSKPSSSSNTGGFSFGAPATITSASSDTAAKASSKPSFSFGTGLKSSSSAPAPSGSASSGGVSFSFGTSSSPAAEATATSGTSFSFGTSSAPAPSLGGFKFGAPTTSATPSTAQTTTTGSSGLSFGASSDAASTATPAPANPAPSTVGGGFAFGGPASAAPTSKSSAGAEDSQSTEPTEPTAKRSFTGMFSNSANTATASAVSSTGVGASNFLFSGTGTSAMSFSSASYPATNKTQEEGQSQADSNAASQAKSLFESSSTAVSFAPEKHRRSDDLSASSSQPKKRRSQDNDDDGVGTTPGGSFAFGSAAQSSQTLDAFSSAPAPSMFGTSSATPGAAPFSFGSTPGTATTSSTSELIEASSKKTTSTLFGGAATTVPAPASFSIGGFGASNSSDAAPPVAPFSTVGFGSKSNSAGTALSSAPFPTGGGFGSTSNTSGTALASIPFSFGSGVTSNAPLAPPSNATTSAFGSSDVPAPAPTFGGFGDQSVASSSTGAFGSQTPQPGAAPAPSAPMFGTGAAAPPFGSTMTQLTPHAAGAGFGSQPFGTPATLTSGMPAFGTSQPAGTGGGMPFGQSSQPFGGTPAPANGGGFGGTTQPFTTPTIPGMNSADGGGFSLGTGGGPSRGAGRPSAGRGRRIVKARRPAGGR